MFFDLNFSYLSSKQIYALPFLMLQAMTYYILLEYNDRNLFVNEKRFNNGRLKSP